MRRTHIYPFMDTTSLIFQTWYKMRYVKLPLSIIFIFIFLSFSKPVLAQTSMTNCTLNLQIPSLRISSSCEGGNWGGFLPKNCCGVALERYLYALGKRANQTGQIYLNATEQMFCLDLMRNYDEDVFGCGIERFTSGGGGCSDFMVKDVENKLRKGFKSLGDDCKLLGNEGGLDFKCSDCLRSWIELGKSSFDEREPVQVDADICRFAVLVSLMSEKIDDVKLVDAVYRCLGESDYNGADQGIKPKRSNLSPGLIVLIAGLIGMALVVFFVLWQFFKRKFIPNGSQGQDLIELLPEAPGCQKIPIKEIYAATDDLNVVNFIGQGIAGKVYKGILPSGRHVAVKHIIKDGYVETFVREVTSLSHVRHPNLVALLGYCEEEEECFLVYELCSNGNLSEWLFGKDKYLSWIQRLEIAIDGARGLWFLHTYPEGCIVHRDIKPTNILLGDHFEAKLSDFGLSKIMELGQSYVSSEVRGTFGYVDPEYQTNHRVNPAGDVYSFGIVLLQILSGKRVINLNVKRPMALDKMAKLLFRGGNMLEFADPKLNGEYSMEAFDLVLKLALSCTAHKQQRPSMEQVVTRLEEALDISTSADATPYGLFS